jgi:hypothetical protein
VENTALGNEAVDVASETVQALGVLHEMALAMGDHSTAGWTAQHQQAMLKAFHHFTSRANVMQAWSCYGVMWTVVNDLLGVTPDVPQGTVAVVPEVPASWPSLSVSKLRVGGQDLAVNASHQAGSYRTQVSGAAGLSLTIGTVLPAGAKPRSVTLNGQKVPYKLVSTPRGNAVMVLVKAPAAEQTLAVQTAG